MMNENLYKKYTKLLDCDKTDDVFTFMRFINFVNTNRKDLMTASEIDTKELSNKLLNLLSKKSSEYYRWGDAISKLQTAVDITDIIDVCRDYEDDVNELIFITDGLDTNMRYCFSREFIENTVKLDTSDDIFMQYRFINYLYMLVKYKDKTLLESISHYTEDKVKRLFYILQPITEKLGFVYDSKLLVEDNMIKLSTIIRNYSYNVNTNI